MTDFEEREIFDYKEVYFAGKPGAKKVQGSIVKDPNCGYDDERGDYKHVVGDHIAYRYEVIGMLGQGSFGKVYKCRDHKVQKDVALKMI